MLPKRKLIKKRHNSNRYQAVETSEPAPASLLGKLQSIDTKNRQEGLAFVASMCHFSQGANQNAILLELINILYQGNISLVHQCIFALANLCELEDWICSKLFQIGFDKALIQLKSNQKQLLKPILVLMISLHAKLPKQFQYLQLGMQSSITSAHLDSNCLELVLQFLVITNATNLNKQVYTKIYSLFNNCQKFKVRSMSLTILLRNQKLWSNQQLIKDSISYIEELIFDIDLENQYKFNIANNKPVTKGHNSGQTGQMQEEQMEAQQVVEHHPNYQTFIDTVDGVQLLYELILYSLQENSEDFEDQSDDEDDQLAEQKNVQIGTIYNSQLHKHFLNLFQKNPVGIFKNLQLSFSEGINIISLALRLLTYIHQSLTQQIKNQVAGFLFKNMQNIIQNPPSLQIMDQIITVSLYLLLKSKISVQYDNILLSIGENILKPKEQFKNCWIILLEIYSNSFNPQKSLVSIQQNHRVAVILKNLLINIPHINLQQWRAQVIDTIFDVFSNESFDKTFVELGFVNLLQTVLERAGTKKKKKFIREVLFDISRFLQYKKKMIKF